VSWLKRKSEVVEYLDPHEISPAMAKLLSHVDAEAIIIGQGDVIIYMSENLSNFKLQRDNRVSNDSLQHLIRAVRRSGNIQEATMELPRGPLGTGTHDLLVRVIPLDEEGLIAFSMRFEIAIRTWLGSPLILA